MASKTPDTAPATISLSGCDDSTDFTVDCTPEQLEFLKQLSRQSYATSSYGCMPVLIINDERLERTGSRDE